MNKVAIAFLTKDRTELSVQSIQPLLQPDKFDLVWCDGSATAGGVKFAESTQERYFIPYLHVNVKGGPDAAIVYALTDMLSQSQYDYVGLCESDVLLDDDWFESTMALFDVSDELYIGAVSPRAYEDRILIQRDGYAIMHNLGAGCVIFTREAAQLILDNYRTGFSLDNRIIFNQRSGIDIGTYWAFRGNTQWLTADWHFDAALATYGLCSLALTPAKCKMIGQTPSLEEQGLRLITGSSIYVGTDYSADFARFIDVSRTLTVNPAIHTFQGQSTYFPHQLKRLGAVYAGEWGMKWAQGYGPFAWQSTQAGDTLTIPLSGVCDFLVSGGKEGGQVELVDTHSGYTCAPHLSPEGPNTQIMSMPVPAGVSYRGVTLKALSPGVVFYGIRTGEPQVWMPQPAEGWFTHADLPPPIG